MLADDVAAIGPFIRALLGRQRELKKSDVGFAAYLGIAPSYWSRLKRGKRAPTILVIRQALKRWPELTYHLPEELSRSL